MYHQVVVAGNLGNDPETREVGETTVTSFSLASNRKWKNRDGEQQEETVWFRVSVWGAQGETVAQYMSKGRQVLVIGRLKPDPETGGPRVWEGDNGPRASFELTAQDVRFLSGGERGDSRTTSTASVASYDDDDLPF